MEIKNYAELDNPIHIAWRKGTTEDPYIERVDVQKVVHQRIALLEIPDRLYRARISGMQEINHETFVERKLEDNEFYVDYSNGFIFFSPTKEAFTMSISYRGKGFILYPATRIITENSEGVTQTLQSLIDESKLSLDDLSNKIIDYQELRDGLIVAINASNVSTSQANAANEKSAILHDQLADAYETTKLVWKPFVQAEEDIEILYPNPEVGWITFVYETGVRYRFDGDEWIPIDLIGGSVPVATSLYNGLLSKEDYSKLYAIQPEVNYKVIVFIAPRALSMGILDVHALFPFDGEIAEVKALCSKAGLGDTLIYLEKSNDMINWTSVMNNPIRIPFGQHFDIGSHTFSDLNVNTNEVFRLNVSESGDLENLTVEVKIKLK